MSDLDRRQDNGRSLIFEKLTLDERRAVDVAIIERLPPTLTAVWMDHKLGEKGISYSAFYRYARRLRTQCELHDLAELTPAEDPEKILPRVIARQLLDAILSEDVSSDAVHRLANAYRIAANVRLAADRFENQQCREQESQDKLDNLRLSLMAKAASDLRTDQPPEPPPQIKAPLSPAAARIPSPPPARDSSLARKPAFLSKREMLDSLDIESVLEARRNNSEILEGRRARASPRT